MKLDKYDRMFIAFMFVVVTLVSICSCVFAAEDVDVNTENGLYINIGQSCLSSNNEQKLFYLELEPNYNYNLHFDVSASNFRYAFGNELSVDAPIYNYAYIGETSGFDLTFNSNNYNYLYFYLNDLGGGLNSSDIVVSREAVTGMQTTIGGLVDNVGVSQLWGVFESGIDFVGVVVLCAFGFFLVFLLIKKITKGKSDF